VQICFNLKGSVRKIGLEGFRLVGEVSPPAVLVVKSSLVLKG
jgi:hypothetical protein